MSEQGRGHGIVNCYAGCACEGPMEIAPERKCIRCCGTGKIGSSDIACLRCCGTGVDPAAPEPQTAPEQQVPVMALMSFEISNLRERIATLEKALRDMCDTLESYKTARHSPVLLHARTLLRAVLSGERGCPHKFVEATLHGQSVVMCEDCGERE